MIESELYYLVKSYRDAIFIQRLLVEVIQIQLMLGLC